MRKTPCLCLVDDDEVYQFLTKKAIEDLNADFNVIAFTDGEQAFQYIYKHANEKDALPDVILLDLNMPFMDGWSFMEEYITLKPQLQKKITIYVVSSSVDEADISRVKSISEVTDYIIKPVSTEDLSRIISIVNT